VTVLALPGLAFIVVTILTLCAPPMRAIYGGRLTREGTSVIL